MAKLPKSSSRGSVPSNQEVSCKICQSAMRRSTLLHRLGPAECVIESVYLPMMNPKDGIEGSNRYMRHVAQQVNVIFIWFWLGTTTPLMNIVMKILSRIESMVLLQVFIARCSMTGDALCSKVFKTLDGGKTVESVPQTRRQISVWYVTVFAVPDRIPLVVSETFGNCSIILFPVLPVIVHAFAFCMSTCSYAFVKLKLSVAFLY